MTSLEKEYEAFRAAFLAQFARLAGASKKYIGGMSSADREYVLEWALHFAWIKASTFKPTEKDLLTYWRECLTTAVQKRKQWRIRRFDRWEWQSSGYITRTFV